MGNRPHMFSWTLLGAGSGVGGLLLTSGCAGGCTACFGCVVPGIVLVTATLLCKQLPDEKKGDADGMATRID